MHYQIGLHTQFCRQYTAIISILVVSILITTPFRSVVAKDTGLAAATIVIVNSTDDGGTTDCTNSTGKCTLRAALQSGASMIHFNIPGTGPFIINPTLSLPLGRSVTIDGYTQPGSQPNSLDVGNNAIIMIELNGTLLPAIGISDALSLDKSTVRGLAIVGFKGAAIRTGQMPVSGPQIFGFKNRIEGNFIGVHPDGSPLGNGNGIIINNSQGNLIGGVTPDARNVISGNGVGIRGSTNKMGADYNAIEGNYIGTNPAGTIAIPNTLAGIYLEGSGGNNIGGTIPGARNVISGNGGSGIILRRFMLFNSSNNKITSNFIGTNAAGTTAIPNDGAGVFIDGNSDNVIGGLFPSEGNRIAFNAGAGISIIGSIEYGHGNRIGRNAILDNGGLGINLGNDGLTANDLGDGDDGPNALQNYPVLSSATSFNTITPYPYGRTIIQGMLNSVANRSFSIDFYSAQNADPSGYGEGETFLGSTIVITDNTGNTVFRFISNVRILAREFVTATATDGDSNTSEFARAVVAVDRIVEVFLPIIHH